MTTSILLGGLEWGVASTSGANYSDFLFADPTFPLKTVERSNRIPANNRFPAKESAALPDCLTANWSALSKSGLSATLYGKMLDLAMKPADWRGPGSKILNSLSVRFFLKAWADVSKRDGSVEPFITLAPSGMLYAEWHRSWNHHLDAQFNADGTILFGITQAGRSSEGLETLSDFMRMMTSRRVNPFSWTNE